MKTQTPFQDVIEVLKNMPPAHREKLVNSYKEFSRLKAFCEVKGFIEILPGFKGVKVIKDTIEVKELRAVVDILKPGNFIWLNVKGIDELLKKK